MNSEDVVQCHDLKFKKLYTRQQISDQINRVAAQIDAYCFQTLAEDPNAEFVIVGILNGAFMFVSEIVQRLKNKVTIEFIKVKSYKGTESAELQIVSSINQQLINGRNLIVIDDICDTGKTLSRLNTALITKYHAKSIKFAVLVIRPDKQHHMTPDFIGMECSEFIIGMGLDYNQQGRQYSQIYQRIKE